MKLLLCIVLFSVTGIAVKAQSSADVKIGMASYYHSKFEGRKTANGQRFSNKNLTAASNHYKLGTKLKVTNVKSGQFVIVEVNDRMAKSSTRVVDLTQCAARQLCFIDEGLCKVRVEIAGEEEILDHSNSMEIETADSSENAGEQQ